MSNVLEVKDRVQRLLGDLIGSVEIDKEGDFTFLYESTRIWVSVRDVSKIERVVVEIYAITNLGLQPTPELYEYVATRDEFRFGAPRVVDVDGAKGVVFKYSVVGDTLDPGELETAVYSVMAAADTIDDEIKNRFGGVRWVDR